MSTLSQDIIIAHILTRLPVKSLIRFKYVCKSWNHILSNPDPQFITSHFTHTSRNPDYECLIMTMCYRSGPLSVHFPYQNHVDIISRSRMSYTRMDNTPIHSSIVGSINGIICLLQKHMFLLWNPVTCLGKTISMPPQYSGKKWFYERFFGFCLDYHVQGEEVGFKIVVCYKDQKFLPQGFVYTFSTDSWNEQVIPDIYSSNGTTFSSNPDITVLGCPYWNALRGSDRFVFKFESGSNQFKKFLLPFGLITWNYILANVKDCPTVMAWSNLAPTTLVDVFHLDEECGVWSKTHTLGPIHCVKDGLSQCFKYGGEIVFNNAEMLYDPKTRRIKVIGYGHSGFVSGYSYTPSLVFLPGMEPLHTQSHWRSPEAERPLWRRPAKSHLSLLFSRLLESLGWNGGQMLLDCLGWDHWD